MARNSAVTKEAVLEKLSVPGTYTDIIERFERDNVKVGKRTVAERVQELKRDGLIGFIRAKPGPKGVEDERREWTFFDVRSVDHVKEVDIHIDLSEHRRQLREFGERFTRALPTPTLEVNPREWPCSHQSWSALGTLSFEQDPVFSHCLGYHGETDRRIKRELELFKKAMPKLQELKQEFNSRIEEFIRPIVVKGMPQLHGMEECIRIASLVVACHAEKIAAAELELNVLPSPSGGCEEDVAWEIFDANDQAEKNPPGELRLELMRERRLREEFNAGGMGAIIEPCRAIADVASMPEIQALARRLVKEYDRLIDLRTSMMEDIKVFVSSSGFKGKCRLMRGGDKS